MATDLRVCVSGDSYVAGVGDPQHLGWVGRVAARTHLAGQPLTAYVLGVRGHTTSDMAARWHAEVVARLPLGCDGRVVLAVRVNDTSVEDGAVRVPAPQAVADLERVLQRARGAGWPALVVGPPPVADRAQNERIARLDDAFSSVCAAAGVSYVPVFDRLLGDPVWMRQVAEGDGAHPAAAGYERLAECVWPQWDDWVNADG